MVSPSLTTEKFNPHRYGIKKAACRLSKEKPTGHTCSKKSFIFQRSEHEEHEKSYYNINFLTEIGYMEYADRQEDTQAILKAMLRTLFLEIARRYRLENTRIAPATPAERIMQYMQDHSDIVTLKDIAEHFSYNPNYVSSLLRRETGRTFSEILLEKRMERAVLLLENTTLSIEEISAMLGYTNHSNFYKAFREYYHASPRDYTRRLE